MDVNTPLLRRPHGDNIPANVTPLTRLQRVAIFIFSIVRILRGILFLVYPLVCLSNFDITPNGATYLLGSLLGSRDAILGILLYTADHKSLRELRRAVLACLMSDAADTLILITAAVLSWHWRHPVVEIIIAAMLAILEHLTLWSLRDEDGDGAGRKGRNRDGIQDLAQKQRRLDLWLLQLRRAEERGSGYTSRVASPVPSRR